MLKKATVFDSDKVTRMKHFFVVNEAMARRIECLSLWQKWQSIKFYDIDISYHILNMFSSHWCYGKIRYSHCDKVTKMKYCLRCQWCYGKKDRVFDSVTKWWRFNIFFIVNDAMVKMVECLSLWQGDKDKKFYDIHSSLSHIKQFS